LRNSQLLTALITSLGAVIGVSLLIKDNYFKIRDERYALQDKLNALQAVNTARLDADAKKTAERAKQESKEAAQLVAEAERAKAAAKKAIIESNEQIKAANDLLAATKRQLKDAQLELEAANALAMTTQSANASMIKAGVYLQVGDWNNFNNDWNVARVYLQKVKNSDLSKLGKISNEPMKAIWTAFTDGYGEWIAEVTDGSAKKDLTLTHLGFDRMQRAVQDLAMVSSIELHQLANRLSTLSGPQSESKPATGVP
jgi:predicted house-cleaning NTP pyrophosphatase (Maf/HAM1 superfamily)